MATHPSILAWKIPWTEELGGLQSMGCKELDTTDHTHPPEQEEMIYHVIIVIIPKQSGGWLLCTHSISTLSV